MARPHVVELSHILLPGKEQYRLEIKPQKERSAPASILYEITMWSHVGTHVEYALHFMPNGRELSTLPLWRIIGPAVRVDLRHKATNEAIDIEDMAAAEICEGDIVITWTGRDNLYRTPSSHDRPYVTKRCADWLANQVKIRALGSDSSGFEVRGGTEHEPNHYLFFDRADPIPVFECMANLDQLMQPRFFFIGLPLRVVGLDAWPMLLLGIEGTAETNDAVMATLDSIFALR
jgi:arylformamidase